jgi:hypothetical protein
MQRGRRLVYTLGRGGPMPVEGSEDYELINRVLAAHNNMAMYVRRGVIRKDWALDGWHHTLLDLKPGATVYINERVARHSWRVWTDLENLFGEANSYRSGRPCCASPPRAEQTGHNRPRDAEA